tara:strand:- start:287 stop:895 length:609 start_codon:yes stop_codon:yes gene_type:complete
MKDMKSTPKEMSIADKYRALHRGGEYKILKEDGSFRIKNTGYGNGAGFKNILKPLKKYIDQNEGTFLLDYGCGSAEIWHVKQNHLGFKTLTEYLGENLAGFYRYDPYHPKYEMRPPDIKFDLTILNDVIEHVPLKEIPSLLKDIANLTCTSGTIILSIPERPSLAHFIDGENMHCTLMPRKDWMKLIRTHIPKHKIIVSYTT